MSQSPPFKGQILVSSFDSDLFVIFFLLFYACIVIFKAVQYLKGLGSIKIFPCIPQHMHFYSLLAYAHIHPGAQFNSPVLPVFKVTWPLLSL